MEQNHSNKEQVNGEDKKIMHLKIVIVGSSVVGKSCLLQRYTVDEFTTDSQTTIGIEFAPTVVEKSDAIMKINIMDTAGQEKFASLGAFYYRDAKGALLVFDVTSQESFESIPRWLKELRAGAGEDIIIMLIGNKSDLDEERVIDYSQGADFAKENDLGYYETSAKTGFNVKRAFNTLIDVMYHQLKEQSQNATPVSNNTKVIENDEESLKSAFSSKKKIKLKAKDYNDKSRQANISKKGCC